MEIKGFSFAGICAGIKKDVTKEDLGIIVCDEAVAAAGLFTRNQVKAAPVMLSQKTLETGQCRAVLVNSGNANCFTGQQGLSDARKCIEMAARTFDVPEDQIAVASTGVIGAPLPMDKFTAGIPSLSKHLGNSREHAEAFSRSILTTDTCTKTVEIKIDVKGHTISMMGIAKGSGMIRPDMATMLAFVVTDACVAASDLKAALVRANEQSFSRITVDGDTSTNDTLICMASGKVGEPLQGDDLGKFQEILTQTCAELAKMVARDGEGATKLVHLIVQGAVSPEDALEVAQTIAHSSLVKTAVFGEDPNWGRITAAAGRADARVEQDKMDLFFGKVPLVIHGQWQGKDREVEAARIMKEEKISITLDLNLGDGCDEFWFCDFSKEYVSINADYRS